MYSLSSLGHLAGYGSAPMQSITVLAVVIVFLIVLVVEAVKTRKPQYVIGSVLILAGLWAWFFLEY